MKNLVVVLILCLCASCAPKGGLTIDASKKLHKASIKLNGANMEDLNAQCYGGMYSQLLYGQDFEEFIDVDFLNLPATEPDQRSMIGPLRYITFLVLDENNKPYLTIGSRGGRGMNPVGYPVTEPYELSTKRMAQLRSLTTGIPVNAPQPVAGQGRPGQVPGAPGTPSAASRNSGPSFRPIDSLPKAQQQLIMERINGDKVISRYWKEVNSGSAKGIYKIVNKGQYNGRRDQVMKFVSGNGEVGLDNMGLMRMGINFQEGKNYEGELRVKNPKAGDLYVALLNSDGTIKLAEKAIAIKASPNGFQKVEFELIPSKSDTKGRFAIIMKHPGEVTLGYAFLQPGTWGRVKGGYPIRQDFIDQLKANGMNIIRYNGSMNNSCPDSMIYMWRNMIGPKDERLPYTGNFTPYATHGFGIFEFLMVAEAAGLDGVVGISKFEDPKDIKNMIEYANGPVTSTWGAVRAKNGHPDPLNLKYIQISNEQRFVGSRAQPYFDFFKGLATEIWKADPTITVFVSLNISATSILANVKPGDKNNEDYNRVRDFLSWVKEQGREKQFAWDSHYGGAIEPDTITYKRFGLHLQDVIKADIGFNIRLFPLEENGPNHTFNRGMAHGLMQNRLNRWGDRIEAAATANMFQPETAFFTFSQGRVFYDSYRFWNQTSGHIDQMFTKEWLPWVLDVKQLAPADSLDVLVKESEDGKVVSMYVSNYGSQAKEQVFNLAGFAPKSDAALTQIGPHPATARNSGENTTLIVPVVSTLKIGNRGFTHQFPGNSFSVIRMEQN